MGNSSETPHSWQVCIKRHGGLTVELMTDARVSVDQNGTGYMGIAEVTLFPQKDPENLWVSQHSQPILAVLRTYWRLAEGLNRWTRTANAFRGLDDLDDLLPIHSLSWPKLIAWFLTQLTVSWPNYNQKTSTADISSPQNCISQVDRGLLWHGALVTKGLANNPRDNVLPHRWAIRWRPWLKVETAWHLGIIRHLLELFVDRCQELCRTNPMHFKDLSNLRTVAVGCLRGLALLCDAGVVHCDMKALIF